MVDDYVYFGIDFHHDPELALPDDKDWDASLDKKHVISFQSFFCMFLDFMMFLVDGITKIIVL